MAYDPNYDPNQAAAGGDNTWRDVSQVLDPLGIGGQGGIGGSNLWGQINGTRAQNPNAGQMNMGAGQSGQAQQAGAAALGGGQMAAGPNMGQSDQMRGMQLSLIQQLQDQAAGRGPSLAQMQLQQGTDRNMQQAMALGQSQRGAGAAGMAKGIAGQQAGIAQGMAGDSAMLRLQEQMMAQQALGQQLGGARGQDIGVAGMGLQNNQFNSGQMNNMGMFNAGQQNQMGQFNAGQQNQLSMNNANNAAAMAQAQAKMQMEREKMLNEQAKTASPMGAIGGILAAFSDERLKTDIKPGESKLYAFLDKLGAHDYKYKDPKHGDARISPMAQELEKSDLGKAFVFEAKDGKAVDYGKGLGTMLASQAALHKRLKKLEEK